MATATFPVVLTPRLPWRAYAALGAGIFFVAWSAILVKWAAVPATTSAFYRVFFAALVLLPAWAIRNQLQSAQGTATRFGNERYRPLSRNAFLFAVLAGVFFAADLALYNSAILTTSAANATLLGNSAPVGVALGTWMLFGKRPSIVYWTGLVIATLGTLTIVGENLLRNPAVSIGDVKALVAALFFAAYLITVERIRAQIDTLTLVTITVSASAAVLFLMALVTGAPLLGYSASAWGILLTLGVITQVGGYLAITYALGHLPATVTSICLLVQAPLTAALAVPLLGETLTTAQLAGGALVLVGIYLVNQRRTA